LLNIFTGKLVPVSLAEHWFEKEVLNPFGYGDGQPHHPKQEKVPNPKIVPFLTRAVPPTRSIDFNHICMGFIIVIIG
jgi:hypothetical protein